MTIGVGHRLDAQFYYEESCRNATGAFTPQGNAKYTGNGTIDPVGNGWLQLTQSAVGSVGYVLIQESFPSNLGLTMEFDFKVWGNSALADGLSVFLFDASVTNFNMGYFGGCLGYLPHPKDNPTIAGLSGAYLGILIDELGNTSNFIPGVASSSRPHVISIVGPENASPTKYPYVSSTGLQFAGTSLSGTTVSYSSSTSTRPADNVYYRRIRIQLDPAIAPNTGMDVTVYLKNNPSGQFIKVIESVNVPYVAPASLRLGFAGSTGSKYAYHEVRDMIIMTSGSLAVHKNIDMATGCEHNSDTVSIVTTVANGDNVSISGIAVSDTLPAGFDLISDPPQPVLSGGGSYAVTPTVTALNSGKKVYSYELDINQVGTVQIKYSGTISDVTKIGNLSSAAEIKPPVSFTDNSFSDNYARAEVPVTLDYSDAPANYGQAAHLVFECLKLGTWSSANKPEVPTMTVEAGSDANDNAVTIVNDGNGFVDLSSAGFKLDNAGLKVNVAVHNSSNIAAKLVGWIDFNRNGTFDPDEAVTETVAANSNNSTKTLVWTNANARLRNGVTYLRLRITTNKAIDATDVSGLFFNGEVEDYKLNFNIINIKKTATSNNKYNAAHAMIGDTISYTISVTNKIEGNITVFDPIPVGTEYINNSADPSSGTLTDIALYGAQNISAVKWDLGNKAANTVGTLKFKVRLTSYPVGVDSVFNIAYAVMNSDTVPSTGNACDMAIIPIDGPRANSDTVGTFRNTPTVIDVLANDDYPFFCTPELTLLVDSYNNIGKATVSSGKIVYTPDVGKSGIDSVRYQLKCNDDRISTATVYVIVSNPLSLQYVACQNVSVKMGFSAISGVTYRWYRQDGSVVSAAANSLTVVKGSAADIGTWWVEPRYGKFVFPRHRIDLELGDCGVTNPAGCAVNGTLLYKEDFGGNSPIASAVKPAGIPQVEKYTYSLTLGCNGCGYGIYTIAKTSATFYHNAWYKNIDDHTYPNDVTRGYLAGFDGSEAPGQFYKVQIDNLCSGSTLYFSSWIANILNTASPPHTPRQIFIIEDTDGNVLAQYYTNVPNSADPTWKQYGFKFVLPDNTSSIVLKIVNNGAGSNGNDFAIDDIEVRLCAPPVTTNIIGNDTTVCAGNNLNIIGTYTEDCTFGNNLAYFWEFRHVDSVNWKPLPQKNLTINCAAANPADRTITDALSIAPASKADEGYYRISVSSQTNIGSVNCRAISDSVYVHIVDRFTAPDIRLQICPSPPDRSIQLSKYLDSTDYSRIKWEQISSYPVIANTETGLITDGHFLKNTTYTYKYTLLSPPYSGCGSSTAKVYIRTLNDHVLGKTVDTITICSALATSRFVNLNQIFGLELGDAWSYPKNANSTVTNNITTFVSPSKYAGAVVFNAQKAYAEADNSYDISYKGVASKAFDFVYTASSCVNVTKHIVLVVTL
jgi:uncharacterized repeat protein (TIGR01451 family)